MVKISANKKEKVEITSAKLKELENQIYELRRTVRYDIRELTIQIIVDKYEKGLDYNEDGIIEDKTKFYNVLYIPEYQRDFTWNENRQSKFIESVILGLPIPLIFVAENKNSAWEIVDGSQRIRTLHAFVKNELVLKNLEKITHLNGFRFQDLDTSRQGKFLDTSLRMIVLSEEADDEVKQDMFERINRGSDLLRPIQLRRNKKGLFTDFIFGISEKNPDKVKEEWKEINSLLIELTPMDNWYVNRDERAELVLRFFALTDNYYNPENHKKDVQVFLDNYLVEQNKKAKNNSDLIKNYSQRLLDVLHFVKKNSEYGFREDNRKRTKRVIFEALSVGVHFALKEKPNLTCKPNHILSILNSDDLKKTWSGNAQVVYALDNVKKRIEIVKNGLLKNNN